MGTHAHERPLMMSYARKPEVSATCMATQSDGRASRYVLGLMGDHVDGHPFGLTPIHGVNKPSL